MNNKRIYPQTLDSHQQWESQRSEDHKQAIESFTRRENAEARKANIKLLKAIGRVALKVAVISLIVWGFLSVWEERLPH